MHQSKERHYELGERRGKIASVNLVVILMGRRGLNTSSLKSVYLHVIAIDKFDRGIFGRMYEILVNAFGIRRKFHGSLFHSVHYSNVFP